jgi:hypothetical protein
MKSLGLSLCEVLDQLLGHTVALNVLVGDVAYQSEILYDLNLRQQRRLVRRAVLERRTVISKMRGLCCTRRTRA